MKTYRVVQLRKYIRFSCTCILKSQLAIGAARAGVIDEWRAKTAVAYLLSGHDHGQCQDAYSAIVWNDEKNPFFVGRADWR